MAFPPEDAAQNCARPFATGTGSVSTMHPCLLQAFRKFTNRGVFNVAGPRVVVVQHLVRMPKTTLAWSGAVFL